MRECGAQPEIAAVARALSFVGEHGALWLAAGLVHAAVDRKRRRAWLRATVVVGGAHLVSVGVKRVVRRARPGAAPYPPPPKGTEAGVPGRRWQEDACASGTAHTAHVVRPGVPASKRDAAHRSSGASAWPPLVSTAGRYSFPSSHATSAAAAAVAFGALLPAARRLLPPVAAAMCVSRLVVGVHYPTDIAAGAALGGLAAHLGHRWTLRPLAVGGGHDD
ncbi:phosphatase PAP2 family protein [Streptomyces sp. NPDC056500]|uniref:phosphatase PAP2 family protein n=1 Tax=Streptomyces sp. NPDC056500 TaxID=3345840 RepID=UPI0036A30695